MVVTTGVGVRWERCYWHPVGRDQGYHCILQCTEGHLQQGIIWPNVSLVLRLGNHAFSCRNRRSHQICLSTEPTKHTCSLFLGSTPVPGRSEGRDIPVLRVSLISDCHPWVQSPSGRLPMLTAFPSAVSSQCGEPVLACFHMSPLQRKQEPSGCNGKAMTRKRRLSGTRLRKSSMDILPLSRPHKEKQPRGECI